jgi:hypothetical protein
MVELVAYLAHPQLVDYLKGGEVIRKAAFSYASGPLSPRTFNEIPYFRLGALADFTRARTRTRTRTRTRILKQPTFLKQTRLLLRGIFIATPLSAGVKK